ncbi:MAG: hypothetical protein K0S07_862 [Chlamydiales bacterium]|jgi:hypothetical protein|nr:hypothetical protein [Chlamydiales bacterium]
MDYFHQWGWLALCLPLYAATAPLGEIPYAIEDIYFHETGNLLLLKDQTVYQLSKREQALALQDSVFPCPEGLISYKEGRLLEATWQGTAALPTLLFQAALSHLPVLEGRAGAQLVSLTNGQSYLVSDPLEEELWSRGAPIAIAALDDQGGVLLLNSQQKKALFGKWIGDDFRLCPLERVDGEGKKLQVQGEEWIISPFWQETARGWQEGKPLLLVEHALPPKLLLNLEEGEGAPWEMAWRHWLFGDQLLFMSAINLETEDFILMWRLK